MIELPIWVFLTGLGGFLAVFGAAVWRLRGFAADVADIAAVIRADVAERAACLEAEQAKLQSEHHAHEDICAYRYKAIEEAAKALERRMEEQRVALVQATDERHRENRANFAELANKLDRLLTAKG